MNDKENKAIKRCYRRINELKLNFAITNEDLNAIETVLNLIENQKAEIEDKDREIIRLGRKANEYKKAINCKDCDCCICEAHINTLELRVEIENKDIALRECERNLIEERQNRIKEDKIINLMAEKLVKAHEWFYSEFDNYTKEDFIKYFERKVEEEK